MDHSTTPLTTTTQYIYHAISTPTRLGGGILLYDHTKNTRAPSAVVSAHRRDPTNTGTIRMRHANIIGKIPPHIHGTHAPVPFTHLPDHVRHTWINALKHDLNARRIQESSAAHMQHGYDNHATAREHTAHADHIQLLLNNLIAATSNTIVVPFTVQAQSPSDYADARRTFDHNECITHAEDPYHVIRDYVDDITDMYNAYREFTQWLHHYSINDILQSQRWNVAIIFRVLPHQIVASTPCDAPTRNDTTDDIMESTVTEFNITNDAGETVFRLHHGLTITAIITDKGRALINEMNALIGQPLAYFVQNDFIELYPEG